MTRQILNGRADVSVVIRIVDSTDGTPETGVVFDTAGIDLEYRREGAASTDITEVTLAALTTAHTDGGFLHIGNGYYRLDLPDAACAVGVVGVLVHGTVTGMVVIGEYIELVSFDSTDSVRLGLSAIPSASPGATGGLFIAGTNAATTITTALTANVTGNVSGSVGSVTGAVGSVTGAVGSVTGAVGSVTGAVGSVAASGIAAASFAAGAIDAAAIAANAIGASELAADAASEIAAAVWDKLVASHNVFGSFGQSLGGSSGIAGRVNDIASTTTDFDTDGYTEATNNHFNQHLLVFTTGAAKGQGRLIYTYTGAGQNVAFDRPFTDAPADNDEFLIFGIFSPAIDVWLARAADVEANTAVLNARSAWWAAAKLLNRVASAAGTLTIYEDDDVTGLFTQAVTTDAAANPITDLNTN